MKENIALNIYEYLTDIKTLGPGDRFVLWLQGCDKRCPSCVSPEMKARVIKRLMPVEDLLEVIFSSKNIDGITISGGEPFLQAEPLKMLLKLVKEKSDLNTMVYTGFTIAEIESDRKMKSCLEFIDLLIEGRFRKNLTKALWRGSINQRIISPSGYFSAGQIALWEAEPSCGVEMRFTPDGIMFAGIPETGFIEEAKKVCKVKL